MHEGVFTERIVQSILTELNKHPGQMPRRVRVKIGEVFHLIPESVRMHFDIQTQGTSLQGVHLDLIEEPMRVNCGHCRAVNDIEDHHLMVCPLCFSTDVKPVSGNSITVETIELC